MRSRRSTSTRAMGSSSRGFLSGVGSAIGGCISAIGGGASSFMSSRRRR